MKNNLDVHQRVLDIQDNNFFNLKNAFVTLMTCLEVWLPAS